MRGAEASREAPLGPGSRALDLRASDGAALRGALRPGAGRGLVLILQGRSEYLEKYAPVADALAARGFASASVDWRGQGGSARPVGDARRGHVGDFAEYARDLDALAQAVTAEKGPRVMLAHSMGGAIGLSALAEGLPVAAAVFSAPMWGLAQGAVVGALGRVLARAACATGFARAYAPGGSDAVYVLQGFEDNVLTRDAAQFARLGALARAHPDLMLGGPTWGWVRAAYAVMDGLSPGAPPVPHLTLAGTDERVTSLAAMRARSGAALRVFEGARHEPLFETDDVRAALWAEIDAFLAREGL